MAMERMSEAQATANENRSIVAVKFLELELAEADKGGLCDLKVTE